MSIFSMRTEFWQWTGFILANGGGIYDAKPENMRAMVDTARKHGWH